MNGGVWAIVPAKPFRKAKSRLAAALSPSERAQLSREFLAHTLSVLAQSPGVIQTVVVSGDPAALFLARASGAQAVEETGGPDLNAALAQATRLAVSARAAGVLVLAADLPLLAPADVAALLDAGEAGVQVTLAPDRHDEGTNALVARPPGLIQYAFGAGSFARHAALCDAAGARMIVVRRPGVALDVDAPEDLALYRETAPAPRF